MEKVLKYSISITLAFMLLFSSALGVETKDTTKSQNKTTQQTKKKTSSSTTKEKTTDKKKSESSSVTTVQKQQQSLNQPGGIISEAGNAILVDQNSGNVMWSKNAYDKAYPASTTKLMTAIIYYEKFQNDLDRSITVGEELKKMPSGSSHMSLKEGEIVTREQLIYGLMLVSGNDAAIVMAYDHSGSIEAFAQVMNQKAKDLGMLSTNFVNPHGFHDEEHYTTAADFAILTREYMKYEKLRQIGSESKYDMPATNLREAHVMFNSNRLISVRDQYKSYTYDKATGLKTGFTNKAKNCFVGTASNGFTGLIFVGFGYEHTETRFTEAKKIMEYGFNNFSPVNVYDKVKDARMFVDASSFQMPEYEYGHVDSMVQINAKETVSVDNSVANILDGLGVSARFSPALQVEYPINEGDFIGYVEYYANDTIIYTAKAYATKNLPNRKIPGMMNFAMVNSRKGYGRSSFMEQVASLALEQKQDNRIDLFVGGDGNSDNTTTNTDTTTGETTDESSSSKTSAKTTDDTSSTSSKKTTEKTSSKKITSSSTKKAA